MASSRNLPNVNIGAGNNCSTRSNISMDADEANANSNFSELEVLRAQLAAVSCERDELLLFVRNEIEGNFSSSASLNSEANGDHLCIAQLRDVLERTKNIMDENAALRVQMISLQHQSTENQRLANEYRQRLDQLNKRWLILGKTTGISTVFGTSLPSSSVQKSPSDNDKRIERLENEKRELAMENGRLLELCRISQECKSQSPIQIQQKLATVMQQLTKLKAERNEIKGDWQRAMDSFISNEKSNEQSWKTELMKIVPKSMPVLQGRQNEIREKFRRLLEERNMWEERYRSLRAKIEAAKNRNVNSTQQPCAQQYSDVTSLSSLSPKSSVTEKSNDVTIQSQYLLQVVAQELGQLKKTLAKKVSQNPEIDVSLDGVDRMWIIFTGMVENIAQENVKLRTKLQSRKRFKEIKARNTQSEKKSAKKSKLIDKTK